MKLTIVLVHNKGDKGNTAQIEALKTMLDRSTEYLDGQDEETGEIIPNAYTREVFKLKDLPVDHELFIKQIIPYGVTPPENRDEINNGGMVYYGEGDEDKIGDHPRFFNWAMSRGMNDGADVVLYLEDVLELDMTRLSTKLSALRSTKNKTEFVEDTYGKMATQKLYSKVSRLDETKQLSEAITEMKADVEEKGMLNG